MAVVRAPAAAAPAAAVAVVVVGVVTEIGQWAEFEVAAVLQYCAQSQVVVAATVLRARPRIRSRQIELVRLG